jgi:RHS repeat-associated protein
VRYFLGDVQGSTRLLSDETGAITSSYDYSAFGKLVYPPATLSTNAETAYLYTGQQYDAATEMYSLRARYYAPGAGRFVSRDVWPVDYGDPWELNRYGYAGGNPGNYSDPSGWMAAKGYSGLLGKIVTAGARGVSHIFSPQANPFTKGFVGGTLGHLVGKAILRAFQKPDEKYSHLDFLADISDLFLSALYGILVETTLAYPGLDPSLYYGTVFAANQFWSGITESLKSIKDWFLTPVYLHELDESLVELFFDLSIAAISSIVTGGVAVFIAGLDAMLSHTPHFPVKSFVYVLINTITLGLLSGGVSALQGGFDGQATPPDFEPDR